ncbi:retrovirus-related pol polyprotein from transposon TNT 1-94 [Tanacetum coccineum]|uniref:Retrovirus-related pol polyprotein from transposon TNT 1-94 n=1 Tax=Tanacetum coccineum TaxID=301880 RepID=A0ABQ5E6J4_9ASTR
MAPFARLILCGCYLVWQHNETGKFFKLYVGKSSKIHGELKEEVFVHKPEGFIKIGEVDRLQIEKKALYGLKEAPRAWYMKNPIVPGDLDDEESTSGFVFMMGFRSNKDHGQLPKREHIAAALCAYVSAFGLEEF